MTNARLHLPFTFGIPVLPRSTAGDWSVVENLLGLTLCSLRAQTDGRFRVFIVGHDRPGGAEPDERFRFIRADWAAAPPGPRNDDAGRKRYVLNRLAQENGGGLLMILDADDWIDTRLVETARARIGPDRAGGLIRRGFATDLQSLKTVPLPGEAFGAEFFRLCGSSGVMNLRPGAATPLSRDPFGVLSDHYRWPEAAAESGLVLADLDVQPSYVVNTSGNHSELHGPFAAWRRTFNDDVNRTGRPLDRGLAARFGLDIDRIRLVSETVRRLPSLAE